MTNLYHFADLKKDIAALAEKALDDSTLYEEDALKVIAALELAAAAVDYAANIRHAAGSFPPLQDPLTQAAAQKLRYQWGKVNP